MKYIKNLSNYGRERLGTQLRNRVKPALIDDINRWMEDTLDRGLEFRPETNEIGYELRNHETRSGHTEIVEYEEKDFEWVDGGEE